MKQKVSITTYPQFIDNVNMNTELHDVLRNLYFMNFCEWIVLNRWFALIISIYYKALNYQGSVLSSTLITK